MPGNPMAISLNSFAVNFSRDFSFFSIVSPPHERFYFPKGWNPDLRKVSNGSCRFNSKCQEGSKKEWKASSNAFSKFN
jgi:hypothetical protein